MAVTLRSFKLRFRDTHVFIVPATDALGALFRGPGVDVFGDDAARLLALGQPLARALAEFEPGVRVRALSLDLERARLLATLDPTVPTADPRPRVVRADAGALLDRLLAGTGPLLAALVAHTTAALARRTA